MEVSLGISAFMAFPVTQKMPFLPYFGIRERILKGFSSDNCPSSQLEIKLDSFGVDSSQVQGVRYPLKSPHLGNNKSKLVIKKDEYVPLQRKLERIGEKKAVKTMEKESFPIKPIGKKD